MIAYISERLPTIIGATLVFGVFILIVVKQIKNRRQHKGGCGGGCGGCPHAGACHTK